ncbi:transmembrane protein 236-like [Brienomyrus brachyistius]|uniref:transmembrane protein 236-like n=1 Tax=Brienomyrus brachyistius TaxID=42636 RepID=UPI0020B18F4C|nr:transmembrane protein 236-like [Brienomyrus brachyistius]
MGSRKVVKLALCEVLQFNALVVPLLVVMQKFAAVVWHVRSSAMLSGDASTPYWLIVAVSVAYVTTVALLVWVPMKYLVFKKRRFLIGRKKWRPVALAYVVLSTLPCFAFLIASAEVQISSGLRHDAFTELPVSLVLLSLICIDITERIRQCRLTGQVHPPQRDADIPSSLLTGVGPLSPRSPQPAVAPGVVMLGQVDGSREQNMANGRQTPGSRLVHSTGLNFRSDPNGTIPGLSLSGNQGRQYSSAPVAQLPILPVYYPPQYVVSGPLRFLSASDSRAEVFVDGFLFWLDTVEMVRAAMHPVVFYSRWVFPIYISSYLSILRVVVMPGSTLLATLGIALQDIPFLFIRIGLVAIFGFVTPLLYLLKNLLLSLAFFYFNFVTKLRIFNTQSLF